jgi:hypothetical protein
LPRLPCDGAEGIELSATPLAVLVVAPRPAEPHQRAVTRLAPRSDEELPPELVAAPEVRSAGTPGASRVTKLSGCAELEIPDY